MENKESKPESKFKERLNYIISKHGDIEAYCGTLVNIPAVIVQAETLDKLIEQSKISAIMWLEYMLDGIKTNGLDLVEFTELNEWLYSNKKKPEPPKPVDIVKPDFEKLYPGTPLNDNAFRRVEGYVWGCEKIWTDYVLPIIKERDELKKEIEELKVVLVESTEMLDWHLNKSQPQNDQDQSDFFNGTANAIEAGQRILKIGNHEE